MLYTIEDKTLTALGDAVRNKTGMPLIEEKFKYTHYGKEYETEYYLTKIQAPKYRYIINGEKPEIPDNKMIDFVIGIASGVFNGVPTGYGNHVFDYDYGYEYDFPLSFECDKPYIYIQFCNSHSEYPDFMDLDITVIPLDENGEEYKYTPLEMVEKINSLATMPEEALTITGDCLYRFANSSWDWFIKNNGDKIITTDIINPESMFLNSKVEEIPFDINIKSGTE